MWCDNSSVSERSSPSPHGSVWFPHGDERLLSGSTTEPPGRRVLLVESPQHAHGEGPAVLVGGRPPNTSADGRRQQAKALLQGLAAASRG